MTNLDPLEQNPNEIRAMMLFESSGRSGFDLLPFDEKSSKIRVPDVEVVKRMLHRENELRLSRETQRLLTGSVRVASLSCFEINVRCLSTLAADARTGEEHGIYYRLQKRVVAEFGYEGETADDGVRLLRGAVSLFGGQVSGIPLYVKYNR
jgi:hypothetical protein